MLDLSSLSIAPMSEGQQKKALTAIRHEGFALIRLL